MGRRAALFVCLSLAACGGAPAGPVEAPRPALAEAAAPKPPTASGVEPPTPPPQEGSGPPPPTPPANAPAPSPERPPAAVAGEGDAWQPPQPAGRAPAVRTAGDLRVDSPPAKSRAPFHGRMRTHVDGALSAGSARVWIGPEVPTYVHLKVGATELFLLDEAGDEGHIAFYRAPYGSGSCTLGGHENCAYGAALFDRQGKVAWSVDLGKLLSRPDQLEIQDVRYAGGVLYFNEACQSYSREAGGRCSSLVAYDPRKREVVWRTPPLVSNNELLVVGDYLLAGYGFTGEPDHIEIVRRADGKIMQRRPMPAAHESFTVLPGGVVVVRYYYEKTMRLRMVGFDGPAPRLEPIGGGAGR